MEPSVGIFWGVRDDTGEFVMVTDRTALATAEPYGDCLTHAQGHYEVWERWRHMSAAARAKCGLPQGIADHEYEDFPRGRVVYHQPSGRFWIYADRRLQQTNVLDQLRSAFGLPEDQCVVRSDPHYR